MSVDPRDVAKVRLGDAADQHRVVRPPSAPGSARALAGRISAAMKSPADDELSAAQALPAAVADGGPAADEVPAASVVKKPSWRPASATRAIRRAADPFAIPSPHPSGRGSPQAATTSAAARAHSSTTDGAAPPRPSTAVVRTPRTDFFEAACRANAEEGAAVHRAMSDHKALFTSERPRWKPEPPPPADARTIDAALSAFLQMRHVAATTTCSDPAQAAASSQRFVATAGRIAVEEDHAAEADAISQTARCPLRRKVSPPTSSTRRPTRPASARGAASGGVASSGHDVPAGDGCVVDAAGRQVAGRMRGPPTPATPPTVHRIPTERLRTNADAQLRTLTVAKKKSTTPRTAASATRRPQTARSRCLGTAAAPSFGAAPSPRGIGTVDATSDLTVTPVTPVASVVLPRPPSVQQILAKRNKGTSIHEVHKRQVRQFRAHRQELLEQATARRKRIEDDMWQRMINTDLETRATLQRASKARHQRGRSRSHSPRPGSRSPNGRSRPSRKSRLTLGPAGNADMFSSDDDAGPSPRNQLPAAATA